MNLNAIFAVITTILTLVNIFQWFDRRSKNKALQNFLEAIHDISKRLEDLEGETAIKQKSQDICSVVNAAIVTVGGYNKGLLLEGIANKNKKSKI